MKIDINESEIFALLNWFSENKEPHFFRENRNPYRVWVSEVALQQTRLSHAIPKLKIFFHRFPTLESLASASVDEVVLHWAGLGYYSRAKNLHKGAKLILEKYENNFPNTFLELQKIPSIGRYTAAAIASICFQEKVPVVDGNVYRICARYSRISLPPAERKLNEKSIAFVKKFMQHKDYQNNPGMVNEAIMELGQKICTIRNPQCKNCPLNKRCLCAMKADVHDFPAKKKKKLKKKVFWEMLFIFIGDSILVHEYKDFRFLKGHRGPVSRISIEKEVSYSLPNIEVWFREISALGTKVSLSVKTTITHHDITLSPIVVRLEDAKKIVSLKNTVLVKYDEFCNSVPSSALQKAIRLVNFPKLNLTNKPF